MTGAATPASIQRLRLAGLSQIRVTGTLTRGADLAFTLGRPQAALLILDFAPPHGLPYHARLHLGTEVADCMQAEAVLPYLRIGALVSVAGDALAMRTVHGHAALRIVRARALAIPIDLIDPNPPKEQAHAHAH